MTGLRLLVPMLLLLPAVALAETETETEVATETIELTSGDKVTGEVVERTDDTIVLVHPLFGRLEIPVSDVKPPEGPNPGLFGTGFLAGWTRTFSLGFSGQQGNSDTNDLTAALDGDYEDDKRRWEFDARYNLSTADGETTKNNAMTSLGHDWLFEDSPWFAFAKGRFDYDDFRSWEFRIQGQGGIGYAFVERETFDLRARTGPSLVQEWNEDQFRAEWLIGPELVWEFLPHQKLEASNFFYYAFTPWAQYRNVSSAKWKWDLVEDPALNLSAGVENEYQSDVEQGNKNNDLKYFMAVGLDF